MKKSYQCSDQTKQITSSPFIMQCKAMCVLNQICFKINNKRHKLYNKEAYSMILKAVRRARRSLIYLESARQ
jgi:hypothetical protein